MSQYAELTGKEVGGFIRHTLQDGKCNFYVGDISNKGWLLVTLQLGGSSLLLTGSRLSTHYHREHKASLKGEVLKKI